MRRANKQEQSQSLAGADVWRWCLQAFILPFHMGKIAHGTEKDIPMQDQMPKTMMHFAKWEDDWLLIYKSNLCFNAR